MSILNCGCFRKRRKEQIDRERDSRPAPQPPPQPLPNPIVQPTTLMVNNLGMGFWTHDWKNNPGIHGVDNQIPAMGKLGNIFWVKDRFFELHNPGNNWLICVEISKKRTVEENVNFLCRCQNFYGDSLIGGTFWEEPDLGEEEDIYNPDAIDARLQDIREQMSARGCPLRFPLGPNLSCLTGVPHKGMAQIREKGLPVAPKMIWIESYPIVASRFETAVMPAFIEIIGMLKNYQMIGVVNGVWWIPGQQKPGRAEVDCGWNAWNDRSKLGKFAHLVRAYFHYRWSTDKEAIDCKAGVVDLPEVRAAIEEKAALTGWRVY